MKTISKKAQALFRAAFTRDGRTVMCSAIDTCQGSKSLWSELEKAGLVKNRGRGCLGHPFSIEVTESGRSWNPDV